MRAQTSNSCAALGYSSGFVEAATASSRFSTSVSRGAWTIFSFGAVLYELVTGRCAFDLPTPAETLTAVLRDEPPPIAACGRTVPTEVEDIVRHCIEKEPADRNPANAEPYFWLALCVGISGRLEEGLAYANEGARLEPHSPNSRAAIGWPLLMARRYGEAAAELAAAVARGDSPFALWSYGTTLSALGRHEEAVAAHRTAVELTGGRYTHYVALLAGALAQGGRSDEARTLLADLDARSAREYVPPYDRAVVLTALGEDDAALGALEQAYEQRNAFLWARIHFPNFERLAPMPRYRALVDRLARRAPLRLSSH